MNIPKPDSSVVSWWRWWCGKPKPYSFISSSSANSSGSFDLPWILSLWSCAWAWSWSWSWSWWWWWSSSQWWWASDPQKSGWEWEWEWEWEGCAIPRSKHEIRAKQRKRNAKKPALFLPNAMELGRTEEAKVSAE